MIGKLTGVLDSTGEDWVLIDVGGVGYRVSCSARTFARMPASGAPVSLVIETFVREDQIRLLGFIDDLERSCFRALTGVQGVGVRMALGILGVLEPEDLAHALVSADMQSLMRTPGVGARLAQRLVTELKDKLPDDLEQRAALAGAARSAGRTPGAATARDAVSALVRLGYAEARAGTVVAAALRSLGADASVAALIRSSLKELAP